jgi:hypothetical protein
MIWEYLARGHNCAAVDAAVAALTRNPGIGAMWLFRSRLDGGWWLIERTAR